MNAHSPTSEMSPGELSPLAAYSLAEAQKKQSAQDFFQQIAGIYQAAKAGAVSPDLQVKRKLVERQKQNEALAAFVKAVDERLGGGGGSAQLNNAVRLAYREIATQYGLKQVDPLSPGFKSDLAEFHRNYVTNFPISTEQETKSGFSKLWSAPTRENGYKEVAYSIVCPFTGKFLMGTNFTIQPESNSVHFIYGFVMPWARGAIGFSRPLVDTMTKVAAEHSRKYPTQYAGKPIITFEKNILGEMTLGDILMDTAGIDIKKPPHKGANLTLSSIDQSLRDLIWSRMGGKIVDYNYIQSSLDTDTKPELGAVVRVKDPKEEKLAIRYLNKDARLTAAERKHAEKIMQTALNGRDEGCTVLNLCVFVPPDAKSVNAGQIKRAMEIFQGISVVKDPEGIKDDIYFKASMADLDRKTKNGAVHLTRIPAFGGNVPGVKSYQDAADLTKVLLQNVTWNELRANADRPYGEWLDAKLKVIAPVFAAYKAANQNTGPRRGKTGLPSRAAAELKR